MKHIYKINIKINLNIIYSQNPKIPSYKYKIPKLQYLQQNKPTPIYNPPIKMSQLILNIQNIKLLFLLATGLYSFAFLHRYKKTKKIQQQNVLNSKQLRDKLKNMKFQEYNSQEIYNMFVRSSSSKQEKKVIQQISENKKKKQDINLNKKNEEKLGDKKLFLGKSGNQADNVEADIQAIMSQHLLRELSKTVTVESIRNQLKNKGCNFKVSFQSEYQQSDLEDEKGIVKIKPCRKNQIKLKDAIIHAEIKTSHPDFQFFPPYQVDNKIDIEDEQPQDYYTAIQKKRYLRHNSQMIRQINQITIENTNAKTKHKKIEKQRLKKYKKRLLVKKRKGLLNRSISNISTPRKKYKDIRNAKNSSYSVQSQKYKKICRCNCTEDAIQMQQQVPSTQPVIQKKRTNLPPQIVQLLKSTNCKGLQRIITKQIHYQFSNEIIKSIK